MRAPRIYTNTSLAGVRGWIFRWFSDPWTPAGLVLVYTMGSLHKTVSNVFGWAANALLWGLPPPTLLPWCLPPQIGFGDMDITKPYKFIWCAPKLYPICSCQAFGHEAKYVLIFSPGGLPSPRTPGLGGCRPPKSGGREPSPWIEKQY